ncbi:MAG TPA: hypothetical protein VG893_11740 [Terracidiphilus sp.]|nr:hypothetical protein [Terracidiphilus sp.]
MDKSTEMHELRERLELIESMIQEGRRKTESWGWTFLLWGAAYFVAIFWASWGNGSLSMWGHNAVAWPVTMIVAAALTTLIGIRMDSGHPHTTLGRAAISLWIAVGVSMILIFPALATSGRLDVHLFVALVGTMLGTANGASALMLKWKIQFGCAVVWWAISVAACFVSDAQLTVLFLLALFLCQIVFGVYAMTREARRRKLGAAHA